MLFRRMRISKIFVLAFVLAIFAGVMQIPGFTAGTPSYWAEEKVNSWRTEGLIPETLDGNYQDAITRAEYTKLVMKLYDKLGKTVTVVNANPFTDVSNSQYKDDIIQAYNAGIVAGYGNGLFIPDAKINREEITVLLAQFIKVLRPSEDMKPKSQYKFVDAKKISGWAMNAVTYAYEKKIMRGTAELQINPKDNSTREQAILLVNNLSNIFDLFNKQPKPTEAPKKEEPKKVETKPLNNDAIGDLKVQGAEKLPELEKTFPKETSEVLKTGVETIKDDPKLSYVEVNTEGVRNFFEIDGTVGTVQFVNFDIRFDNGFRNLTTVVTKDPSYEPLIELARKYFALSKYKDKVNKLFDDGIASAKAEGKIARVREDLSDKEYFEMLSVETMNGMMYTFKLQELPAN